MLAYEFMRHALLAAGIIAILAAVTGYFLVLRQQSFAGHALSHVGFAGAAASLLIGAPPLAGLLVFAVIGGIAMGFWGERAADRDVAIGVVLAVTLGLGVLFLSRVTVQANAATSLLFGNIFGVDVQTLKILAGVCVAGLGGMALIWRKLLFATLHPELAQAHGVGLRALSVGFLVIVAFAVAASAQIVGVLLVFTLLVAPAASAQRLCKTVAGGVALTVGLALMEAVSGVVLAYVTDTPASFWISLLGGVIYVAAQALG